jgi:hypothetical protein
MKLQTAVGISHYDRTGKRLYLLRVRTECTSVQNALPYVLHDDQWQEPKAQTQPMQPLRTITDHLRGERDSMELITVTSTLTV